MDLRDSLRAAFGVERLAIWVVAALAVAVVVSVASASGGLVSPPSASFEADYDAGANAVTIGHTGGNTLTATQLAIVVTDTSSHTTTVSWPAAGERVRRGDDATIDDPTVDSDGDGNYFDADATVGFELTGDATVRIDWTGRPFGAPEQTTVTLSTLGNETGS
jgi:hypothetical protein